ncbi:hypothetical protein [Aquisalimonas asiatica]|uniref:Uncharacterized protein n=1 Tax=Aquisalimonas asiatica TaxID=406100 RepID=A0A1H8UC88_9GAMM|nr:hypothetical protein [Aquisalimonas asiatica]SEP00829.1 hypothetical protein SAMN04488052_10690 [Aquisalimonas asiatica]
MSTTIQQLAALGRLASRLSIAKPGPRRALIAAEASGYASAVVAAPGSEKAVSAANELQADAMAALEQDRPQLLQREVIHHD